MILLSGHSLTPARKVPLEAQSLQLKERDTTSTITPADMTGIGVNSWLQDDTNPGKGIVYRVRSIQTAFSTNTPTVQLETALNTLRDRVLTGDVTPAVITGRSGATTCTAKQAATFILGLQGDWKLGDFEDNPTNAYKFDGEDLYSALETVTETMKDCYWVSDFSRYPFTLHIRKLKNDVNSELRASRNLITISRTVDRGAMFTRFYPIGANDLRLSGSGFVSKNESAYGVIEKIDTDATRSTEAELRSWAETELELHAEPTVTVDVEGVKLSDDTNEPMDDFTLMRVCRVPLEEYGTTIQARIVTMTFPDKLNEKKRVRITMSNSRAEVTRILANVIKRSGKGARTSSKKAKQDLAWFEDTNEHVAMCAKGIIGVDAKGNPNWERLSQLVVSGEGITGTVTELINGQKASETRFTQNERAIGMVVGSYSVGEGGEEYYIKAGEICLSINEAGESEAKIDANKVYIGNEKSTTVINGKCKLSDVSADYINSKLENIATAYMNDVHINRLYVDTNVYGPNGLSMYTNGVWQVSLSEDNGTYTLTELKLNGDERTVGTFKRATSLSGTWSSGTITVTANDSSVPALTRELVQDTATWASDKKSCTIPIKAQWGTGSNIHEESTGRTVYVDTSQAWQKGWDDHGTQYGDVTVTSVTATTISGNTVRSEVVVTGTASNGTSKPNTFKLEENTFPRDGSPCVNVLDLGRSGNQLVGRIAPLDAIAYGKAQMTGGSISGTAISGTSFDHLNVALTGKIGTQTVATGSLSLSTGTVSGTGEHCVIANVGGNTIARVSTENVYISGKNAVSLADPTWDNNGAAYGSYQGGRIWTPSSRTIYVSTTGRPNNVTKQQWVGLDAGSWENGKKTVYMYKDRWGGTRMAGCEVDIGSFDWGSISHQTPAYSNYNKSYTVNANNKHALITFRVAGVTKRIQLNIIH